MRSFDALKVSQAIKEFLKTEEICDPIEWVSDKNNICLENESGDLCLFEYEKPGVVTGHYYFKSRGRKAIEAGKRFLDEIFNSCYNIHVIRGLTPLKHLGARWMSRQIGLKSHGICKTTTEIVEIFILHKSEYKEQFT